MSYQIRPAVLEDAPRICTINQNALGYDVTLDQVIGQLSRILMRPTDRVFVAVDEQHGCVEGFVHAADYETIHSGSLKNIVSLAVDPSGQGKGIGRLLLTAVEEWALQCGCDGVRLVSGMSRVRAHAFYEHCGYRMRKEQKNYIRIFTE